MAQRTIVQLIDDLDGKPIPDGKGETIRFSVGRTDYEIDLSNSNAQSLRETVGKYVAAARRTGNGSRSAGSRQAVGSRGAAGQGRSQSARDYDPKAVRAWAESQGIEVSQRGRVPADLIAKFQEANG